MNLEVLKLGCYLAMPLIAVSFPLMKKSGLSQHGLFYAQLECRRPQVYSMTRPGFAKYVITNVSNHLS